LKYGYVPYEVIMIKDQLTKAMGEKNNDSILFYAADLCHYVSDANVPLHTTSNYDGQLSNQKGIHALWESVVPEMALNQYSLYSGHTAKYLENPSMAIWTGVRRAHTLLPEVFEQENQTSKNFTDATKFKTDISGGKAHKSYTAEFAASYGKRLGSSINDQLLQAADMVSDFWYTCWVDSGKPDLANLNSPFTQDDKKDMKKENFAFRHNQLIKLNMLLARKNGND
jgi:hypothetical protein